MLVLKLLLVPAFLALVTLVARRWGPVVAGWLAGFPLVTGPILLFIAIENDLGFAAGAASASLAAVSGSTLYHLVFSWICASRSWPFALGGAVAAWFALAWALSLLPPSLPLALAVALPLLLLGPRLFPPLPGPIGDGALPRGEVFARMAAGAGMMLLVTALAEAVGPRWSGMFAVFPSLGVVLAVFSYRANGAAFTIALLRSMIVGQYAIVAFCGTVALLLEGQGVAIAFAAGLGAALATQAVATTLAIERR